MQQNVAAIEIKAPTFIGDLTLNTKNRYPENVIECVGEGGDLVITARDH